MDALLFGYVDSPIGLIEIGCSETGVAALNFVDSLRRPVSVSPCLTAANEQIAAYFAGKLRTFDLPLDLRGTEFQRRVWAQLRTVAYGQTATYLEIALALENPQAVRAVGAANGQNPLAIVVPCHRILGSGGKLIGYGGGLWRKEWLLRHEGALLV
ncbi:MAG: methylated-DNA--[protein]-cysteine S-methyltransferase [Chloroflexi bacterium]|nr:MAG: methylated-DNA--[protein]-cysteine S-methyltransferase [Chloroflexota bacterium]